MLTIDYRADDRRALIKWTPDIEAEPWLDELRRLAFDYSEDASQEDAWTISLPWWSFASVRDQVSKIFSGFGVRLNEQYQVSAPALELLKQSKRAVSSYEAAKSAVPVSPSEIESKLLSLGFNPERKLSPEQLRNVGRIVSIPAAATFSVPGAGKTTEAIASFFYKAQSDDRLLVIAPKNAFAAWDEQLAECMPKIADGFVRLRSGRDKIAKALDDDPRFMLITYQQLTRVSELIAGHCAKHRVHVFLDESHRIKSGSAKQTARSVLTLTHLTAGKLIMSGTPMPQSTDDLVPQFFFLYPELRPNKDNVVELIRPIYVRTTKKELGLRDVTRKKISFPMAPMQAEMYRLMKFEVARDAATALNISSKQAFRSLGRSVARLLQFVSNPALLSSDIGFAHPDLLGAVLAEGDGPKLKYLFKRARELARDGHKVLIWSSFVRNVEYIAERLADLGAVYIHGGVDAGDEDDDETREGKIKQFHSNENVRVMVANPAAASEGVSLHRVCHHALYLDRTFNSAHYLQSEDRIHRFGLPPEQETIVEIIECDDTVDETVRERLGYKITQMFEALEDPSIKPDPIPIDPSDIEDYDDYSTGLSRDDIEALLRDLSKGAKA